MLFPGCASKAKQQEAIRRAYAAGEQAANAQLQQRLQQQQQMQQAPEPQIRVLGPVKNSLLTWSEGLTLMRAIAEAQYQGMSTPRAITVYRGAQMLQVNPQRLLDGEDYPLEAGDIVELLN
jgi:hypothetical protein